MPHDSQQPPSRGASDRGVAPPADRPDDWLPARSGGRSRRWPRLLAVLLVLLLLPIVYAVALAAHASSSIDRLDLGTLPVSGGDTTNILVVGSDSRAGLTPQERVALTTGGDFGDERTDTILLLVTRGSDVAMLSFPRDLWVERCDGSSQRINTAVQLEGLDCLAETIASTSGIGVDHVVLVSFGGFVEVVDAIGGVELCLEDAIQDGDAGIDLPAGCQTLTGPDALGYVRVRKIDDDLQRIRRQQQFLTALASELAEPQNVVLPWRGWPLAGSLGSAISADEGLGPVQLAQFGLAARGLAAGNVVRTTVPTTPTTINGASVLLEAADAEAVYAAYRDGSVLDQITPSTDDAGPRSEVEVVILNGAGIPGLAGRTGDVLVELGYPQPELGNAEQARATTVLHPASLQAEAARLADDVAGEIGVRPAVQAGGDSTRLTLVLGTDVEG